jgi:hypothetical protein
VNLTDARIAATSRKAQAELTNPEKSLTATIAVPREANQSFRYASLANGLDIVRKELGKHEIATVPTMAIDKEAELIQLTTWWRTRRRMRIVGLAGLRCQSRFRKSAQDDKWNFCLTAGTLCPANQERP